MSCLNIYHPLHSSVSHTHLVTQLNTQKSKTQMPWWQFGTFHVKKWDIPAETQWQDRRKIVIRTFLGFSGRFKWCILCFTDRILLADQRHNCFTRLDCCEACSSHIQWKLTKREKYSFSSLINCCETHRQCLIKTLVSHPELLGFQRQETGSGLLNNSVLSVWTGLCVCSCVSQLGFRCARACSLFMRDYVSGVCGLPINTHTHT